jgi:hypothetical protein
MNANEQTFYCFRFICFTIEMNTECYWFHSLTKELIQVADSFSLYSTIEMSVNVSTSFTIQTIEFVEVTKAYFLRVVIVLQQFISESQNWMIEMH